MCVCVCEGGVLRAPHPNTHPSKFAGVCRFLSSHPLRYIYKFPNESGKMIRNDTFLFYWCFEQLINYRISFILFQEGGGGTSDTWVYLRYTYKISLIILFTFFRVAVVWWWWGGRITFLHFGPCWDHFFQVFNVVRCLA